MIIRENIKAQHGFKGNTGDNYYSHSRRCHIHGWHGVFYICKFYPRAIKNKIKRDCSKWKENPAWKVINNDNQ